MTRPPRAPGAAILIALALATPSGLSTLIKDHLAGGASFDHGYDRYAKVIRDHVRMPSVDYSALKKGRAALDAAVHAFAQATEAEERAWPHEQRLAFWINAYNAFTLRAVVDHYPIHGPAVSLSPPNSIRQIDGVWTTLKWRAAGREVTQQLRGRKMIAPIDSCITRTCSPSGSAKWYGS